MRLYHIARDNAEKQLTGPQFGSTACPGHLRSSKNLGLNRSTLPEESMICTCAGGFKGWYAAPPLPRVLLHVTIGLLSGPNWRSSALWNSRNTPHRSGKSPKPDSASLVMASNP